MSRCQASWIMSTTAIPRNLPPMPEGWLPRSELTSPKSDELLRACADILDDRDLLGASSLTSDCHHAANCWRGASKPCGPVSPRLPWVGPRYSESRVLVVAMNAQSHQGLWDEAFCVDQALDQLAVGHQRFFGAEGATSSWFHYRAAAIAALMVAEHDGAEPRIPSPVEAGAALARSARIQTVQCSPATGSRRSPTAEMLRRCPDHLLWPMVECLAPRTIAVLGTDARVALERRFKVELRPVDRLARAGQVLLGEQATKVLAFRHPSSGRGMESIRAVERLMRSNLLWEELDS